MISWTCFDRHKGSERNFPEFFFPDWPYGFLTLVFRLSLEITWSALGWGGLVDMVRWLDLGIRWGSAQHRGPKGLYCAVQFYVLCSMF